MRMKIISKKAIIVGILVVFLGASIIPFIAQADPDGSLWQNTNWSYSRELSLANPINSYQMKIIVGKTQGGDVNCYGHCKNDFSDIRFVDSDKITQLPYWIEKYSSGNQATFWVKLPSDIELHPTILMYYGNPDATSNSDGEATFLWFDNFQTDTTGEWMKVEDFEDKGWIFYNTNYQSSMDSARLRSNVDCVEIDAAAWPTIGEICQGLKGKNDDKLWTNTTVIAYSSRNDGIATETQPTSDLTSTNSQGTAENGYENVMSEGTNGYVTELLYSYADSYVGGKIWGSSNNLLWNAMISSNIPEHMTYLFWYLKDLHNINGYHGAGLYYDTIQKKLIVCCNSTLPDEPWLKLRYNWMFLATFSKTEPSLSTIGEERNVRLFSSTDDTTISPGYTIPLGDGERMLVKIPDKYDALVKFNTSSLPSNALITEASLNLYYWEQEGNPAGWTLTLYRANNDWNEETVTWATQPSYATSPTGYSIVPTSIGHWMKWDVTDDIQGFVDGTINNYGWKVTNDGSSSGGVASSFRTKEYGNYVPYLEVSYILGELNILPTADAGGPYYANVGNAITFDGSESTDSDGTIEGYRWDFTNDGTYDTDWLTSATTTHSYLLEGAYMVTLQVKDDENGYDTDTTSVTISLEGGAIPTAEANGPYSGYVNYPVIFSSYGSSGGTDGMIVSWYWTFGDGTVSSQQNPGHIYTAAGSFTVSLKVTNNYGQTNTDTTAASITALTLNQNPPVANAGGPYLGVTGTPITFDGSGSTDSDGTIITYNWNFGDGSTGTGISATHSYTSVGNYTVMLTVTDNESLTHSDTTLVRINASGAPTIVISIDISNIEPIEEENEKTIPVTVFCYHQPVSNIHLEILESSNLTVTLLSPNISLNPGESRELLVKIKAPKLEKQNDSEDKVVDETIILRAVGDDNVTSNTEQINLKVIEKNATPGFEAIATLAAVGSAGALVTFFRRRNGNR